MGSLANRAEGYTFETLVIVQIISSTLCDTSFIVAMPTPGDGGSERHQMCQSFVPAGPGGACLYPYVQILFNVKVVMVSWAGFGVL